MDPLQKFQQSDYGNRDLGDRSGDGDQRNKPGPACSGEYIQCASGGFGAGSDFPGAVDLLDA